MYIGTTQYSNIYIGTSQVNKVYQGTIEVYSNLESETVSLLARMSSQPTNSLKLLINKTIKDLKDAGIFSKLDVFYIRGLHTEQASHLNWVKNAHNSTNINSCPWVAKQGFTTGTTKKLDLNYNNTQKVNYNQCTDFSIGQMVYNKPNVASSSVIGGSTANGLINYGSSARWYYYSSATYAAYSGNTTEGQFMSLNSSPNGSLYRKFFRDGSYVSEYSTASNVASNGSNYNEIYNSTLNGTKAFFLGGSLSNSQHTTLYNILVYFYNNVGGTF